VDDKLQEIEHKFDRLTAIEHQLRRMNDRLEDVWNAVRRKDQ